ncbi:MAG TPA: DUF4349 domain-containing protein [Candidatus Limnocylindria bacterium]|nr:DUF4349 domain-containing protein [Candidatus Limnocylindria bacterium]
MKKLLVPVLLAVLLAACSTASQTSGGGAGTAGVAVGVPAYDSSAQSKEGRGSAPAPAQAAGNGIAVPAAFDPSRQMILTASVAMRSKDPWAAADRAQAIATGLGGDVVGLSQSGSGDQRTANLVLRVPSARFNDALRQLRDMQDVEILTSSIDGKDVTEQFVDLEARLTAKKAEEQRYVALLARANTIDEILKIDQALGSVRMQIEQLTGQLNSIKNRTQFSTITVAVTPLAAVSVTTPGAYDPAKTVERAFATLVAVMRVGLDLAIWLLVFGWIPLLLLAGLVAAQRMRTRTVASA